MGYGQTSLSGVRRGFMAPQLKTKQKSLRPRPPSLPTFNQSKMNSLTAMHRNWLNLRKTNAHISLQAGLKLQPLVPLQNKAQQLGSNLLEKKFGIKKIQVSD